MEAVPHPVKRTDFILREGEMRFAPKEIKRGKITIPLALEKSVLWPSHRTVLYFSGFLFLHSLPGNVGLLFAGFTTCLPILSISNPGVVSTSSEQTFTPPCLSTTPLALLAASHAYTGPLAPGAKPKEPVSDTAFLHPSHHICSLPTSSSKPASILQICLHS